MKERFRYLTTTGSPLLLVAICVCLLWGNGYGVAFDGTIERLKPDRPTDEPIEVALPLSGPKNTIRIDITPARAQLLAIAPNRLEMLYLCVQGECALFPTSSWQVYLSATESIELSTKSRNYLGEFKFHGYKEENDGPFRTRISFAVRKSVVQSILDAGGVAVATFKLNPDGDFDQLNEEAVVSLNVGFEIQRVSTSRKSPPSGVAPE